MRCYLITSKDIDRFISKTEVDDRGCINWTASIYRNGYGQFGIIWSDTGKRSMGLAHRFAYQIYYGTLPEEQLDHICRNRRCVNPLHLEPVTNWENTKRGINPIGNQPKRTHCPQGHEYNEANTYRAPGSPNKRKCWACLKARKEKSKKAKASKV